MDTDTFLLENTTKMWKVKLSNTIFLRNIICIIVQYDTAPIFLGFNALLVCILLWVVTSHRNRIGHFVIWIQPKFNLHPKHREDDVEKQFTLMDCISWQVKINLTASSELPLVCINGCFFENIKGTCKNYLFLISSF